MSSKLSIEAFNEQCRYLSLRFGKIEPETQAAYYEFLQDIPYDRFRQVCKVIFREWKKGWLPEPQHFLDVASNIAEREKLGQKSLPSDLDLMPESERIENIKRIADMVRKIAKPMPIPTAEERTAGTVFDLDRLRQWLKDPVNRRIALAEAMSRSDIEIITDDLGNPIDLSQKNVREQDLTPEHLAN